MPNVPSTLRLAKKEKSMRLTKKQLREAKGLLTERVKKLVKMANTPFIDAELVRVILLCDAIDATLEKDIPL